MFIETSSDMFWRLWLVFIIDQLVITKSARAVRFMREHTLWHHWLVAFEKREKLFEERSEPWPCPGSSPCRAHPLERRDVENSFEQTKETCLEWIWHEVACKESRRWNIGSELHDEDLNLLVVDSRLNPLKRCKVSPCWSPCTLFSLEKERKRNGLHNLLQNYANIWNP